MSPTDTQTRPRPAGATVQPGSELRRQLEQRRSLRRRVVLGAVALGVLVLVGVLLWMVTSSSVFAARHVTVTGQQELTAEQVQQAAAVPLGVPLARQDLDGIARRTTALPQVAAATVERRWPRTVVVAVTEREPLLAVRQPDGWTLVAARGVAFATRSTVPAGVLKTDADPTATARLVELGVVAAALPTELRARVDRLSSLADGDITLELSSGTTVRWGDSSESDLKASVVAALADRGTKAIDVSAPHNPATR